jgi:multidrug resistance protein, MATE family
MTLSHYKKEALETIRVGMPIVVSQLGIIAMGVADTIQVGGIVGKGAVSVAAAGVANSVFITIAVVGLMALGVIAPMISKAEAEDNALKINKLYHSAVRVALLLASFTLIISSFTVYGLAFFKQDPEVTALAIPYGYVISISVFPLFLFTGIRQLSDGLSKTRLAMVVTISALLLNIILNHVLIHGTWIFPQWGLFGAGVATLLSRIYMALILWWLILRDNNLNRYLKKVKEPLKNLIQHIFKVGIPAGLQGFFEVAVFAGAALIIGWYGKNQQAAHFIAINMCSVTYMMVTGISAAGGIRVGHFWGLHDRRNMLLAGNTALSLAGGFMLCCALIFFIFNKWLVGLYSSDVDVMPIAIMLTIIGGFFQISDGLQVTALGILRGIADVNVPTVITLIAYWGVGLPVGYILSNNFNLKAAGIWIGLTAGLTASAIMLCWRFYRMVKKIKVEKTASKPA